MFLLAVLGQVLFVAPALALSRSSDDGRWLEVEQKAGWQWLVDTFYAYPPEEVPSVAPDSGTLTARWMFPFSTADEAEVASIAVDLIDHGYPKTTFMDPDLDELFQFELASYVSEILLALDRGLPGLGSLLESKVESPGREAVIFAFGEELGDGGVMGSHSNLSIYAATTYPLDVTSPSGEELTIPLPAFLLPLYERYLIQHEFAHAVDYGLGYVTVPGHGELARRISELWQQARENSVLLSCYSARESEYWPEATAIYFSPIPVGSLSAGFGNDGTACRGLTEQAKEQVVAAGGEIRTGAELIAAMQPDLYDLLQAMYGPPVTYYHCARFCDQVIPTHTPTVTSTPTETPTVTPTPTVTQTWKWSPTPSPTQIP